MTDDRSSEVLAVAIVAFVLTWLTVGLRIYVRAGMLRSFGNDDWAMVATQLLYTAYLTCQFGGLVYGTGRHLKDLEPQRAERALSFWYLCEIFYILATVVMKVAIGLFILRVATKPVHTWIIRIVISATVAFGGAFAFIVVFQCWPIYAFWTLNPDDGSCIAVEVLMGLTYGISALNVIADWTFAILPAFVVKDLQMSMRQKGLVAGILALAALGSTATVVRLPYIHTLAQSYLGWNGDFLWKTVPVAIWSTVEIGIGVTAGCMATLRPLLQLALSKFGLGSSSAGGSRHLMFGAGKNPRRFRSPSFPLDGLPNGHGVVTTITGRAETTRGHDVWHSRGSSQERLALPGDITKHVVVEYEEQERLPMPTQLALDSTERLEPKR